MNNPDIKHQFQPQPDVGEASAASDGLAESLSVPDVIQRHEQRQGNVTAGTLFGVLVGLLMGAVAGAASCWLTGQFYFFSESVLIGTLAGPIVGAIIGLTERKVRGQLVRPDIATFIGVLYALLPALLFVLQGISGVRGSWTIRFFVGAVFAGPMIGLVIGGILDRAFEAYQKKSWRESVLVAAMGVSICIGLVCVFDALAYGPDPKEMGRNVRELLTSKWSRSPNKQDAEIHNIVLVRKDRLTYTGVADATFAGRSQRLRLDVVVEGEMIEVSWTSEPGEEQER